MWRGGSLPSSLALFLTVTLLDLISSFSFEFFGEGFFERTFCLFLGLIVGLLVTLVSSTVALKNTNSQTSVPCLIVIFSTALSKWMLPTGVEGGLITLGLAASVIVAYVMISGKWRPEIVVICSGTLCAVPVLNAALLDTSDSAGWDGSRGFMWITHQTMEFVSLSGRSADFVGISETIVVATSIFMLGLLSFVVISMNWTAIEDVQEVVTAKAQISKPKPVAETKPIVIENVVKTSSVPVKPAAQPRPFSIRQKITQSRESDLPSVQFVAGRGTGTRRNVTEDQMPLDTAIRVIEKKTQE